ncbi:MAG TPA: HipA domain-containing protein [Rhizomicrobium sp.]|jgi:serine/threonine-protein kinase HipA
MATALWGKVYYGESYAGELRQEPGGRCVFTYDPTYLELARPSIAFTLPRRAAPYVCEQGLHPFFDNLVAEGWLRNAQARALKIDPANRFALLLAFGHDCAGAVSIIDPSPLPPLSIDAGDALVNAALASRASLSGIQPKLLAVKDGKRFRPARGDELSTYIAKRPSGTLRDIVENEYLTTIANAALLPDEEIVDVQIAELEGLGGERSLLVKRFDRLSGGAKRHFEEFNQLLGRRSGDDKYDASYEDLAAFILDTPECAPGDAWRLYRRVLVCFLTGNTDAHLKNFAMFHTGEGLRLTPAYDLVAAALYPEFSSLALAVGNASNLPLASLKPKHLASLGKAYGLDDPIIKACVEKLDARRKAVEKAVTVAARKIDAEDLGNNLLDFMERRWKGTFASIGDFLSKKRSGNAAD